MKLSMMRALKLSALPAVAALLLGCKAESTVAVTRQEITPITPVVTNVPTNTVHQHPPPQVQIAPPPQAQAAPPPQPAAPATAVTTPRVSPRVQEVVDLAQRGVGDDVLVAFVGKAPAPFNLTAEEILYLNDLGISEVVITAMIRHRGVSETGVAKAAAVQNNTVPSVPPAEAVNPPAAAGTVATAPSVVIAATPEFEAAPQTPVVVAPAAVPAQTEYFYSALAPYGTWHQVPDYGYCWQPTVVVVNPSWRPYCDRGRWIYSDCGWYWHSDYSWGWAPFHYGRWHRHPHRGWLWMPDPVWGPAWVTWRYSDAYCGWAPLPPGAYYDEFIGLSFRSGRVGVSFDFGLGIDCYTYVPTHRFHDRTPWRHALPPARMPEVHRNTTVINNYVQINKTVVNEGISRERLAKITQSEIRKVSIRDVTKEPGRGVTIKPDRLEKNGSELVVYRPQLPKPVSPNPAQKEQPEGRKPSVPNAGGRSADSAIAGRQAVPSVPAASLPSSQNERPAKAAARSGSASSVIPSRSATTPAAAGTGLASSEAAASLKPSAPSLVRSPGQTRETPVRSSPTPPPASSTVEKPVSSPQIPSRPVMTPAVRPSPVTPIAAPPATGVNGRRPASPSESRLVPTPVTPSPYREQPRPINTAPSVGLSGLDTPKASPPVRIEPASPSSSSSWQPSSSSRSSVYPQAPASSPATAIPSTPRQSTVTMPQPYSPAVSGIDSRRELLKPPSFSPVEKPSFSQPIPSYQSQTYSSSGRQPMATPSLPSAPQYSPPARSAPPAAPSVPTVPSTRFQSSPVQSPAPQMVPPSVRPSAPSGSESSRPSGSSRRSEIEK